LVQKESGQPEDQRADEHAITHQSQR
jgi:hypothetical protein